jgi:nucleoside-diphosphate-sugar epimerase
MYLGITGATGKIGRWMVRELQDRGHVVRAMVRPSREGFWGNTAAAVEELRSWGAQIFPADFADDDSLKRFASGIEVLVHNGYHHVNEDLHPVEWTNLNILASVKLYDAFWRAGGKQIIFISSGAVYGHGPDYEQERFGQSGLPIDERTMRAPRGLYATYKSCIEDATVVFKTVHGLKTSTTIRPGSEGVGELLGFRAYDAKGAFADEVRRLLAGEEIVMKLPPQIICVDGRDLGNGCDLLIRKGLGEKVDIGDWYICANSPISVARFQEIFREVFGRLKLKIEGIPQGRMLSDGLIRQLGYQPRGSDITLRDHLQELAIKLGVQPERS